MITGIMGLESTADPEDDVGGSKLTQRKRYELKAIVEDCENLATITGKRSYVGSICGRMELGLIINSRGYGKAISDYELKAIVEDCENLATITGKRSYVGSICGRMELGLIINSRGYGKAISDDGDYVGGIAGLAGGTIRQCLAKCSLSGGSYVGGIVGSGITEDYGGNSGDYVGGIAGLAGGTIRQCLAKCSLSGGSYVGGIVGSGITEDYGGNSSLVTGCYSMVEIPQANQYYGAIGNPPGKPVLRCHCRSQYGNICRKLLRQRYPGRHQPGELSGPGRAHHLRPAQPGGDGAQLFEGVHPVVCGGGQDGKNRAVPLWRIL